MLRYKEIEDALLPLVGWQQHHEPNKQIAEHLTKSESGLTFQVAHPLVTLDNAAAVMPDNYDAIYPIWNESKQYLTGEKVARNGMIYTATETNSGEDPASLSAWTRYDVLSDFLESETRAGISQMVQHFVGQKVQASQTRTLIASAPLFTNPAHYSATIPNRSDLVGFAFRVKRATGVTAKLNRISLQLTEPALMLKLYVFSEEQTEPVHVFNIDYTKTRGGVQWFNLDGVYFKAGVQYYIAYNQNDLPITCEALSISRDWSAPPCAGCNTGDMTQYRNLKKYVEFMPFRFAVSEDAGDFNGDFNGDFANATGDGSISIDGDGVFYNVMQNYGMNLDFEVGCDLTDFIIKNRHIFATTLQLQVAERILRTMALNPNAKVNRNQLNVERSNILYELDGNTDGRPGGLGWRLTQSYKTLSLDTAGIDRDCLSCESKGVRYRST